MSADCRICRANCRMCRANSAVAAVIGGTFVGSMSGHTTGAVIGFAIGCWLAWLGWHKQEPHG